MDNLVGFVGNTVVSAYREVKSVLKRWHGYNLRFLAVSTFPDAVLSLETGPKDAQGTGVLGFLFVPSPLVMLAVVCTVLALDKCFYDPFHFYNLLAHLKKTQTPLERETIYSLSTE